MNPDINFQQLFDGMLAGIIFGFQLAFGVIVSLILSIF
jgi:hypothetical protein